MLSAFEESFVIIVLGIYTKIDKKIQDSDRLHGFAGWSTSSMCAVHKIKEINPKEKFKKKMPREGFDPGPCE